MSLSPVRQEAEEAMAQRYAEGIRSHDDFDPFWHDLNAEIINLWSLTALMRVKERAWQIVEAPEPTKP